MEPRLIGFVRKKGTALRLTIDKAAFDSAPTYMGKGGSEYVSLSVSMEKIKMLIGDQKEVVSICNIAEEG